MKNYFLNDDWKIIEQSFNAEMHEAAESVFSIGNGKMGQRAMFEEKFSGKSLQGSYVAGVYYPDKTRVGWWKNGYPEYFAKVLNSPNWIGMDIRLNAESIDLAKQAPSKFERVLDMQRGLLSRSYSLKTSTGIGVTANVERFVSRDSDEIACIRYSIQCDADASLEWDSFIDGKVYNTDSNYNELFWSRVEEQSHAVAAGLQVKTNKLQFEVAASMAHLAFCDDQADSQITYSQDEWKVKATWKLQLKKGVIYRLEKYVSIVSNLYYPSADLLKVATAQAQKASAQGYDSLKNAHEKSWAEVWHSADIQIEGDTAAQQGIRFNIFQLNQTYTGRDPRLNIGPKGFTGEKYGGSTYWDTEAYCIPFYLGTSDAAIARQLLRYRFQQLPQAIANAQKLGFTSGAALYPMVTMNGEECHNEWEITFEEIHRNGAIAYAIYQYENYTGDKSYRADGGAEVLLGIARFWAQRVHWSADKEMYVMHGVTGPNEYENNVNNNWYTNYIATWCMKFAAEVIKDIETNNADYFSAFVSKTNWSNAERSKWEDIIAKMYFPEDKTKGIFLQQDGFLDKELRAASDLNPNERPINQHWSWDRILRSCFIKQADVLQGLFFFESEFSEETLRRNFDFYEPMTVHESSLSPCIHSVQAAKLGYAEKAYELYLRTSRLDLDDYNKEVHEGLHITSMAGTWIAVVMGFGGMRIGKDHLSFSPILPKEWKAYSFKLHYRSATILIKVTATEVQLILTDADELVVEVYNEKIILQREITYNLKLR
jgi:maltose phosphorylase